MPGFPISFSLRFHSPLQCSFTVFGSQCFSPSHRTKLLCCMQNSSLSSCLQPGQLQSIQEGVNLTPSAFENSAEQKVSTPTRLRRLYAPLQHQAVPGVV